MLKTFISTSLLLLNISSSKAMDASNLIVPTNDEATSLVKNYMMTNTVDETVTFHSVVWKVKSFAPPRVRFSMYGGDQTSYAINIESMSATFLRRNTTHDDITTLIYRVSGLSNNFRKSTSEGRLYLTFSCSDV